MCYSSPSAGEKHGLSHTSHAGVLHSFYLGEGRIQLSGMPRNYLYLNGTLALCAPAKFQHD